MAKKKETEEKPEPRMPASGLEFANGTVPDRVFDAKAGGYVFHTPDPEADEESSE